VDDAAPSSTELRDFDGRIRAAPRDMGAYEAP
jgi:hypothetical protein